MAVSDKSVVSSTTDFLSDSTASDDWQELTKSDYAKVIFSDLLCNAASGTVECKFQITDNVHEDPNDCVGLFRIGYEDLSQCLVSKMLSQTKCEDDGKLQRCVFTSIELPSLDDGFYQFLYVTRDQEVCGASMPFQIKMSPLQLKENSVVSSSSEDVDEDFLLVRKEMERAKEPSGQENAVEHSALSEQKKEEITAWVLENQDYHSLIEQIRDHNYTIDALQESKRLATREVVQLYEILNSKNGELLQLKNMLAAYEEKIKMNQCLQDEKNNELIQMRNRLASYKEEISKVMSLHDEKCAAITEMKKVLIASEEKMKLYEQFQKEKEEEFNWVSGEFHKQEQQLKTSLAIQDQLQTENSHLKRELQEMKDMQKAKESHQVTADIGKPSMENVIQNAQNLQQLTGDALKSLDFTNIYEVEKFYKLKMQILIISSKMKRATEKAKICDRIGMLETIHSVIEQDRNRSSQVSPTPCVFENIVHLMSVPANTSEVEKSKPVSPTFVETLSQADTNETETINEDVSEECISVAERTSLNKAFASEVLEQQMIKLPRLDVINEDTAKTLETDKPLDAEDVTVINRLTEKIIKRGSNLYEAIELVDDCASDAGSDASEISESSSSIKKDLLCVSRVMEALSSYLSNQTSLDHLIVVEKEEDKNLIHRNKWDVLLQKCALRYQIELLLEHIEKQKEGNKKVSEKVCDVLTKCMLLKDEVGESMAVCKKLQSVIEKKDNYISKLKEELKFKDTLLGNFYKQKEELESRTELAEKTIEEFRARLVEASNLYKKQYIDIKRLNKKLQKHKSVKDKIKTSKGESSLSSESSKTASSSFEIVKKDSVQNINDSDTGEHMFEKDSLVSKEKNQVSKSSTVDSFPVQTESFLDAFYDNVPLFEDPCNVSVEACLIRHKGIQVQMGSNPVNKLPASLKRCLPRPASAFEDYPRMVISADDKPETETVECKSNQSASLFSDFSSYEHFQDVIKENFDNLKIPATLKDSQGCSISCYICKEIIYLCPDDIKDLMNHLENEHLVKMCPLCGQLFEDAIPPKYFHIHVEQHFES